MIQDEVRLLFPGWDSVQATVLETLAGREMRVLLTCNIERLHRFRKEQYEEFAINQLAQRPWPAKRSGVRRPGRGMSKYHGNFFGKGKQR